MSWQSSYDSKQGCSSDRLHILSYLFNMLAQTIKDMFKLICLKCRLWKAGDAEPGRVSYPDCAWARWWGGQHQQPPHLATEPQRVHHPPQLLGRGGQDQPVPRPLRSQNSGALPPPTILAETEASLKEPQMISKWLLLCVKSFSVGRMQE